VDTYKANHPRTYLVSKDVKEVTGKEIFKLVGTEKIDLVAGCPPCQGFSQLTAKWKRKDPRNELALEMARLVEEIKPRMVMMENVPGIMNTRKGRRILNRFVERLKDAGYKVTMDILQMADYGVPQSRRRFVLLAGRGFEIPLPKKTHARKPDKKSVKKWVPIIDAIRGLGRPIKFSSFAKQGAPKRVNWHVVSDLKGISLQRLKAIGEGQDRTALPEELRPNCHKDTNKGFSNVYGRMKWGDVAPTMTRGFTSPCKGRFGHPSAHRTISIREAADIQTFPRWYKFETDQLETARDLIGNALPPKFARQAGGACINALRMRKEKKNAR
ncbi:MAG: DNA cytosine methyltransferase, partial [Candidatus Uhrbacteria bacterium]|nr:DNA cytosine methyltransferase [Candidatus Uhrbacteria bacterium]